MTRTSLNYAPVALGCAGTCSGGVHLTVFPNSLSASPVVFALITFPVAGPLRGWYRGPALIADADHLNDSVSEKSIHRRLQAKHEGAAAAISAAAALAANEDLAATKAAPAE